MSGIDIKAFFDRATNTISYVVVDLASKEVAVIDTVLDFNYASGHTSTVSADLLVDYMKSNQLKMRWILETHAHADHLSAAAYLKKTLGGEVAIGAHIKEVQSLFSGVFNFEPEFAVDGSQFDRLLADGDAIALGATEINILHTPGHTPSCLSYKIKDAVFVGDTLFMPDFGTARTDFPGGDASTLYKSIKRILQLPPETRVFTAHDYLAKGRDVYAWESTVAEQKEKNIHINDRISESEFVEYRTTRDAKLSAPALILPAIQVNIRAGKMPPKDDNGTHYLRIPVNTL